MSLPVDTKALWAIADDALNAIEQPDMPDVIFFSHGGENYCLTKNGISVSICGNWCLLEEEEATKIILAVTSQKAA